jgi:hypothetical protein
VTPCDTARPALTDHTIPRHADPFAQCSALASIKTGQTF